MTRKHAIKRLLEHGSMTFAEIVNCTRWTSDEVDDALWACIEACEVSHRIECGLVRYESVNSHCSTSARNRVRQLVETRT